MEAAELAALKLAAARLLALNRVTGFTVHDVRGDLSGEAEVLYSTSAASFIATLRKGLLDRLAVT